MQELLEPSEEEFETVKVAVIEEFAQQWRFFAPSAAVAKEVLLLNDELGTEYFNKEYEKLVRAERIQVADEEIIQEGNWFRWLFQEVSALISHRGRKTAQRHERAGQDIELFQKFVSERIFNHFAMLARTPHAKKSAPFSIKEELTNKIAEKLGLGLCMHQKTSQKLRVRGEDVLFQLALDFQTWFTDEKKGVFVASWGVIRDPNNKFINDDDNLLSLILLPDVQKYFTAR